MGDEEKDYDLQNESDENEYDDQYDEDTSNILDSNIDDDMSFDNIAKKKLYDITSSDDIEINYEIGNNKSTKYLTKYESAKLIGIRAQQIASGAKPNIKVPKYMTDVIEIAELELQHRKIPFLIKRDLPSGKVEYCKIADLIF